MSETKYKGIIITVKRDGEKNFTTFFSNAPGEFNDLFHVKAICGIKSEDAAIQVGKDFVDAHQWQLVESRGIFDTYVRLWWNDVWGFGIRSAGSSHNESGFKNKTSAIAAARIEVEKKIKELECEVNAVLTSRRD